MFGPAHVEGQGTFDLTLMSGHIYTVSAQDLQKYTHFFNKGSHHNNCQNKFTYTYSSEKITLSGNL